VNWLLVIAAAALIVLNAFFVIAEYSLVRARHSRLELAAEQRLRGAKRALSQLESINEYISTCQVGSTMASIGIGALGEPALAHLFEQYGSTCSDFAPACRGTAIPLRECRRSFEGRAPLAHSAQRSLLYVHGRRY